MFAWLKTRLALNRHCKSASERRFCEAYRAYQDACVRGDTRSQHATWEALRDIRTAQLNRALGWRGTR